MSKILRIEDVIIINEDGERIARYVFNDDKVVRVSVENDEILTKDVSQEYVGLIGSYASGHRNIAKARRGSRLSIDEEIEEQIKDIKKGRGAGWGMLAGFFIWLTIIGPIILAFATLFGHINYFSNKNELNDFTARSVNYERGMWGTAIFGLIVGIACCFQWKDDMISVLNGHPNRCSRNGHICFKIWCIILLLYNLIALFYGTIYILSK